MTFPSDTSRLAKTFLESTLRAAAVGQGARAQTVAGRLPRRLSTYDRRRRRGSRPGLSSTPDDDDGDAPQPSNPLPALTESARSEPSARSTARMALTPPAGEPADLSDSPPTSQTASADPPTTAAAAKKKRKKRKKKAAAADAADDDDDDAVLAKATLEAKAEAGARPAKAPPVQPARPTSSLCISRNKHWRHISAYHVRELP
jgi:hypothetical protein